MTAKRRQSPPRMARRWHDEGSAGDDGTRFGLAAIGRLANAGAVLLAWPLLAGERFVG